MSGYKRKMVLGSLIVGIIASTSIFGAAPTSAKVGDSQPQPAEGLISARMPVTSEGQDGLSAHEYSPEELDQMGGDPRVLEYWTPERMDSAIPLESPVSVETVGEEAKVPENDYAAPRASDGDAAIEPLIGKAAVKPGTAPSADFSRTNGKVFFRDPKTKKIILARHRL
ncbi:hypothetical protein [Lysinibacter sp. HNR]|uniref:hypothetical protein n=1 Tax=Lysinibacter sp. HNR TaxID=3031408 RepID=UPI0024354B20|nr:hypothetical protein [Lysinibacter sp. HNR]WGD36920.1 hypothetical protein FrondiHNR_10760 [Lysinibacter sp. HNR]